jgi:hypothetical protein
MQTVVQNLPLVAGVYQYFDAKGKLLYVGKAKKSPHYQNAWRGSQIRVYRC